MLFNDLVSLPYGSNSSLQAISFSCEPQTPSSSSQIVQDYGLPMTMLAVTLAYFFWKNFKPKNSLLWAKFVKPLVSRFRARP